MSLVYIILAHKHPDQLGRLISRVNRKGDIFLIHVDRNVALNPFKLALDKLAGDVHFDWVKPRHHSNWGGVGLVYATLEGLRMAVRVNPAASHIVQISGQCYPIKPIDQFDDYFAARAGVSQMTCLPLPYPWDPEGSMYRINKYHYTLPRWLPFQRGRREYPEDEPARTFKAKVLAYALSKRFPLPRVFPAGLTAYAGHQWFAMTWEMAQFILTYHREHPEVLKFHHYTWAPDEIYFSSIIGSDPEWRGKTSGKTLQYCDWSKPVKPAVLTMEHADILRNRPDQLFARKFDPEVDADVLDWIDTNLLGL